MALVQKKDGSSASTTTLVITLDATTTANNTLILVSGNNNGNLVSVTGGGVTWALVASPGVYYPDEMYSGVVTGTPGTTITITYIAGSRCVAKVMEWAGKLLPDVYASASGTSATVLSGTLTPSQPNALIIAIGLTWKDLGAPYNSFTDQGEVASGSFTLGVGSFQETTLTVISTSWVATSADNWDGMIASFLPSNAVTGTMGSSFGWSTALTAEETNVMNSTFGWSTSLTGTVSQPVAARPFAAPTTTATYTVSGSIDATGATDVTAALNNWVASIPNGSTIIFPPGSTYLMSQGLQISQRNNLILQATGCTLKMKVGAGQTQLQSNIIIGHAYLGGWTLGCTDIQIDGFTLLGNSATPGVFVGSGEHEANLEIGDGTRIEIKNCTGRLASGDFLFFEDVHNAWAHDNHVIDCGRNGFSTIDRCDNILIENNAFDRSGYCTFDFEPNDATYNRLITVRNNTWGTWGNAFMALDGSQTGAEFSDIVVSNNVGTGPNLLTVVTGPGRKQRMTFTGNTSSASGTSTATFSHVDVLSFKFNYQHGVHLNGTFVDCTSVDTNEGVTGTMATTFGWSTDLVGNQNAGVTGTMATTFGWSTSLTGTVVGGAAVGVGETVMTFTPGIGRYGHSYNRFITTNAGAVHAADEPVIVYGEAYLPSYEALGSNVSIATANDHILALMAGASLNLRIRQIVIFQSSNASSAALETFEIRRLTTAGAGGTAVTPAKDDNGDAASGATARTLPSSKGTESTILWKPVVPMRSSGSVNGGDLTLWSWEPPRGMKPLIVAAGTGNGIAVKSLTAIAGATVSVWFKFAETLW